MSAYGALARPERSSNLPSTAWPHPRDPHTSIILVHLDPSTLAVRDAHTGARTDTDGGITGMHLGLFEHLHAVFADEVDRGMTYPQEDMRDPDAFRAYFFAADVVIAVVVPGSPRDAGTSAGGIVPVSGSPCAPTPDPLQGGAVPVSAPMARQDEGGDETRVGHGDGDGNEVGVEVALDLEAARAHRSWDACVVGFYYVKPNYPGRSSHICNAGFVVPPSHRGGGYGRVLARSYLYYAPRLGYEASVFNLVYVNNVASVRLWEKLGFVKAGLIPRAGRLKRTDGTGEEYVDAWIIYKRFR